MNIWCVGLLSIEDDVAMNIQFCLLNELVSDIFTLYLLLFCFMEVISSQILIVAFSSSFVHKFLCSFVLISSFH